MTRNTKKHGTDRARIALGFAFLILPASAQAGETAANANDAIIVTAAPFSPVGAEAYSTTVLNAKALQNRAQLDESLTQVPGLSLFRRNSSLSANPTTQGVSLRSIGPSGASRALVTLDGVPLNDPFGGWVIWSAVPPETIASAEVVRGAGAGPYGAGALTGTIALKSAEETGGALVDLSGGERGFLRGAFAGGTSVGKVDVQGSLSGERSDGWVPVDKSHRGAADNDLSLDARQLSLRASTRLDTGTLISARFGAYDEKRDAGLVGARSEAKGYSGSLTFAHAESPDNLGYRAQFWLLDTDLINESASVGPGRAFTTPSNDQYATPALGWGANAALRGHKAFLSWELGVDARFAHGETRENLQFQSGRFQQNKVSGGETTIAGLYWEGAAHWDSWLFTTGLRGDYWQNTDGHIRSRSIATGVILQSTSPPDKSGLLPSVRAGLRRNFQDGFFVRSAGYTGFRIATLNELYRSFRLGNNVTLANSSLSPERLYGAELGFGIERSFWSASLTGFWNRLDDAVTNVTIGAGPGTFPGAGFVPAGGSVMQRLNAGTIDAEGLEGEASWKASRRITLTAAFSLVSSRVDGGSQAPQLTGKRPAQAPRWTVTGAIEGRPTDRLTLGASLRAEGSRFADDLNTLPLSSAVTLSLEARWQVAPSAEFYLKADNALDARVATTSTADKIISYDAPRIIRVGLTVRG